MLKNTYIPTTIIDGFLDYPEKLRDFALGLEYLPSKEGNWPGIRSTKSLYELSPLVYNAYIQKILNIFFLADQPYNYVAESYFQIISKKYDSGWVHKDSALITAILYLTPDATSGTSLYEKKDIFYNDGEYQEDKVRGNIDVKINSVAREKHNKNYYNTLDVKGIFNRLCIFDGAIYHSAHDYFGSGNEESRLTLVTFFNDITGSFNTPLQRIKSNTRLTVI